MQMNKFSSALIVSGLALVCIAAFTATTIPFRTQHDFDKYVAQHGGSVTHSPASESFLLASTLARSLKNFWIGSTGLVFLACGLVGRINYAYKLAKSSRSEAGSEIS
jgi:hypothetical protein